MEAKNEKADVEQIFNVHKRRKLFRSWDHQFFPPPLVLLAKAGTIVCQFANVCSEAAEKVSVKVVIACWNKRETFNEIFHSSKLILQLIKEVSLTLVIFLPSSNSLWAWKWEFFISTLNHYKKKFQASFFLDFLLSFMLILNALMKALDDGKHQLS